MGVYSLSKRNVKSMIGYLNKSDLQGGQIRGRMGKEVVVRPGWCGSVVDCQPANQKVASSIPSLGPELQARSPVVGPQTDVSLPLSPSLHLSKIK